MSMQRVSIQAPEYSDMTYKITIIGEATGGYLYLNVTLVSQKNVSRQAKSTIRNILIPTSKEIQLEVKYLI